MGLEWILLSVLMVVVVWLGTDACRETKRLHARLARVQLHRPINTAGHDLLDRG